MKENEEKDKFEEEKKELKALYNKATTKEQYQEVINRAKKLEKDMARAKQDTEEIGKAIQHGFWSEYYLKMKFEPESSTDKLCDYVGFYYNYYKKSEDVEGIVQYGYLLSNIKARLRGENSEAGDINSEIWVIARESGDMGFILKSINSRGNKEMSEGNFTEAIKIFSEIEDFKEIPKDAFRYAGNILNQRGISKIRGDVDILGGMKDMIEAVEDYYSEEETPPLKHIVGVVTRMKEVAKKLK